MHVYVSCVHMHFVVCDLSCRDTFFVHVCDFVLYVYMSTCLYVHDFVL